MAADREFDAGKMAVYRADPAFEYLNRSPEGLSLWDQLKLWVFNLLARLFGNPNSGTIADVLFHAFLIAVIIAAVLLFVRMQYGAAFSRSDRFSGPDFGSGTAVSRVDYQKLVKEAIEKNDWKLAIRYLYQHTLASLGDRQLITLRSWKTGADYAEELKGDRRQSFVRLKQIFEYTWYGDFEAKKDDLELCMTLCSELESTK